MMKAKTLLKLFIVALILSIVSVLIRFHDNNEGITNSFISGHNLIKDFAKLNIERIEISSKKGESVFLSKTAKGRWVVSNLYSYPADTKKMDDLLETLSDLKVVQVIHKNKDTLSALGFKSENKQDEENRIDVKLIGENGKILSSFILGKSRIDLINGYEINKGRYVYLNGLFMLVDDALGEIQYKRSYWINSSLVSISDVKSMTLERSGKEIWDLERDKVDSSFELVENKEKEINTKNISKIVASLENLQFDSIADPTFSAAYMGLNFPFILKVNTFSGKKYSLLIGSEYGNSRYVKIEDNGVLNDWTYLISKNRIDPLIIPLRDLVSLPKNEKEKYHTFSAPIS